MRRTVIGLLVLAACLPMSSSRSGHMRAPFNLRTAAAARPLLDLVPASAVLAVRVSDLDLRWKEIRSVAPIARLQDAVLELAGIPIDRLPRLVGEEAVVFLARTASRPALTPIAVLQPGDPREAEEILRSAGNLSYRFGRGALWIGAVDAGAFLDRCVREEAMGLAAIIPMEEIGSRLPEGGLVRGWINPATMSDLLREASHGASAGPVHWLEAVLAAELAAVRYAGFRRELSQGEIITDAVISYDPGRLPPAVFRYLNPGASPSILPAAFPPDALLAAAFRPEPAAWLPWMRYIATHDPHGPLRNLEFWLNEFQQRYRRDLARDLFGAFGEHAWLLATPDEDSGKTGLAVVFELHETAVFDAALSDFLAWLREMAWLDSFGLVVPQYRRELRGEQVALHISLRTPGGQMETLAIEFGAGHLIAGTSMSAAKAAGDWVKGQKHHLEGYNSPGTHGALITGGPQLARLVRSRSLERADTRLRLLLDTLVGSLQEMGAFSAELNYEEGAVRLHGRLNLADRR